VLVFTHFDLLVAGYEKINAINWSNRDNSWDADKLQNSWKTQLSLFLLAENESILPENISITYCFLTCKQLPNIYHFPYNQKQYDCFNERLQSTLDKLPMSCQVGEYLRGCLKIRRNRKDLGKSAEHQSNHSNVDECFRGSW
jgi:hypothetical protein